MNLRSAKVRGLLTSGAIGLVGLLVGIELEKRKLVTVGTPLDAFRDKLKLSAASPIPYVPESLIPKTVESLKFYEIMRHSFLNMGYFKSYGNFIVSYDRRSRNPFYVIEHLNPMVLEKNKDVDRSNYDFFEDKSVHYFFRGTNKDFRGSGYDRGHLAAAGNHKTHSEHCYQTFILSNISPQVGVGFNRGIWNKLEQYVRFVARRSANVWVCTGPLYLPRRESDGKNYVKYEVIGENNIAVPTHFFKVLLIEMNDRTLGIECYVIQNKAIDDNIPLKAFQVPLESVERAAGFLIFEKVPRNFIKSFNGPNFLMEKFKYKAHS